MVGAYVCYAFLVQMQVPFWAALLLTSCSPWPGAAYREAGPASHDREPVISIIMVTIGLSLVLRSAVAVAWGRTSSSTSRSCFPRRWSTS
jgi:branched-chain amino acid transport system permease protein